MNQCTCGKFGCPYCDPVVCLVNESCNHAWVYSPWCMLTDPLQRKRICKLCGLQETITDVGSLRWAEYDEVVKKFMDKDDEQQSS